MSELLRDLRWQGLAGAAAVFTGAEFGGAICGLLVFAILHMEAEIPRQHANVAVGVFWLGCMVFTWRYLARTRKTWPEGRTSTSLFHIFQIVTIAACIVFAVFSGGLQSKTLVWCCYVLEVTMVIFYFNYVFLGLTLRYRMPRSAIPGILLAIGSVWWSSRHLPAL